MKVGRKKRKQTRGEIRLQLKARFNKLITHILLQIQKGDKKNKGNVEGDFKLIYLL